MLVEVNEVVQPIGAFDTIIKFRGTTPADDTILFGVDHRPARDLIQAMALKEYDEPILAEIEEWQILMTVPVTTEEFGQ